MRIRSMMWGMVVAISLLGATEGVARTQALSDAQVKKAIIAESIAQYPGPCACPYNQARNGSACGRRSAWSKQGGYSPLCYPDDVSKEQVKAWRERQQP
ncbi:hypothetical protein Y71_12820 [Kosakonia radicincitans DSM 16656]|uniref:Uncharacterized protein n=2 Tax=Enterobacteriaceae TaxID=543 RepID=A0AAX2EPG0_9ENTR|nr:hypothetical protein A3780_11510 [Kosakonia radicincitans]ARD60758.1 hypothetical protein Y71_12820 [Kosakonia radicincitans DSM 16656]KDE38104.1 hypothetical protein AW40_01100 [Kosakonia radicincitans UMEnt01/12]MDP9566907.1 hypothetical protein [Kosakonia oryzae]NCF07530.1 hypothetical protein [Kosakonia sp. MH5]SEK99685.1 hypothetical protein SAMN04487787_105118 [Kosakonia sacchari]